VATPFNGLGVNLGNLPTLSNAETRSISAENFKGEKGKGGMATEGTGAACARDLGQGWKVSPSINIGANSTVTIAEIDGPGAIQHIWFGFIPRTKRSVIMRAYWDGEKTPSIEVPLEDFFCNGWAEPCLVNSLAICVNPYLGFNTYWLMPFRKSARITIENLAGEPLNGFYYQVDYTLTDVPDDTAYLHAQWRRTNPLPYKEDYTILDGVKGQGHYVGTYLAWGVNNTGWWGEGEIKFFMDGDKKFPTICGTGTEDYFCGSFDWEAPPAREGYRTYCTAYAGLCQVVRPDGFYKSQTRFGMYRWHIPDPIRFKKDLRVTIQALGWRSGGRYLPMQDDIASVAYWYQAEPHAPFPVLPDKDGLEVI
jgi:hypothetical protein